MTSLFISHSSEDRTLVEEVRKRLQAQNYNSLFLDIDLSDGVPAGRNWERELYAALRRSDGVIFLATAASVASRWCFAELALARSLGTPIFALRARDGVNLALLSDVQWVDVAEGESAYTRLFAGMRRAGLDPADAFAWDSARPPYPGLKAFSAEDAAVFFGRNEETRRLMELVQPTLSRGAGRWVSIVGPSGSGKSSLLCAGLLPGLARMPERWVVVPPFVPGAQPTRQLAASLARAFAERGYERSASDLESRLTRDSTGTAALVQLAQELSDASGTTVPNVLVVIDQAEEMITRTGQLEQQSFLSLLDGALGEESPLWVVCTLRSEFLSTSPDRAGLSEVTDDSMVVEPLSRTRLSEVIARPARRAGLEFDPGLIERMVEETTGGDALPLLAYTLRELAQHAGPEAKIRAVDYEMLGGVIGALKRCADRLVEELSARGHGSDILPTLLKLVTIDQGGEPIRRRLAQSALSANELRIIDAFVDARLLSRGRGEGDMADATVEVTHEALLRQWPPLRQAIEESRASLRMRAELEREAADWNHGAREESYLLREGRIAAFEDWVRHNPTELSPLGKEFLDASRELASRELMAVRRSNRRLREFLMVAAAALVIAIAASVVAVSQREKAQLQADLALTRQLIAEASAIQGSQPDVALLLGVAAFKRAPKELREDARIALLQALNRPFHMATPYTDHIDAVRAVAFSPDGSLLASASNDQTVILWDVDSGQPRGKPLKGHTGWVCSVAFSPNGSLLASTSNDRTLRLWDVSTGSPRGQPLTGHTNTISDVAFSPDGSLLATASEDGTVRLWDVSSGRQRGEPLTELTTPAKWSVDFSPDGSILASGGGDGVVRLFDVATGRAHGEALAGHDGWAISVAFSPDGSLLASSGLDGTVRLWDLATRRPRGEPLTGHRGEVTDVTFSPDGSLLASAGRDSSVRLWEVSTGQPRGDPLSGHANAVRNVAFSPDGHKLASASFDGTVRLWNVAQMRPGRPPLSGHTGRVNDVTFSPDGSLLASAGADGTVRLWDVETSRQRGEPLDGHKMWVSSVAFSPDGSLLASAGADGTVRLWDVVTSRPRGEPLRGHEGEVGGIAFSPDGSLLASAGRDGTLRLWQVAIGQQRGDALTGHSGRVLDVGFSPDGDVLASAAEDGSVRLWDVDTGRQRGEPLTGHSGWILGVTYSSDGTTLASASGDGTVRLWDVATDPPRGKPLVGHAHEVNGVAFRPDGSVVASASKDGTVRLWDVSTGQPGGEGLSGHAGEVASVAFNPNGSMLATAGDDAIVRIWDVDERVIVDQACAIVNRDLTRAEWEGYIGLDYPHSRTCP